VTAGLLPDLWIVDRFSPVIRLVLFDIDGTLIRSGGAGVRAFERTFAIEFGLSEATRGLEFAGRTDVSLVRQCFRFHQVPDTPENFRRFFEVYAFLLSQQLEQTRGGPCEGVFEFIRDLRSVVHPPLVGLLTGNFRLGAELKLRHYHLWDSFQTGAFGDDHEDRNCLAALAQQRGARLLQTPLKGRHVLVIGDTPLDIACAQSIQARMLAVATGGYTCEQLQACRPTWVVKNLGETSVSEVCG
jgi:phosphoglycolate phosphatase